MLKTCDTFQRKPLSPTMSTLAEIESAVAALPAQEKQELLFFIASRLRSDGSQLPPPRKFTREQMQSWIAEDEAEMEQFNKGA